jgi:hypothetical protein
MVKILAGELKLVFRPFLEKFRMAVPGIEALLYRSAFYNENIPRSAIWKSRFWQCGSHHPLNGSLCLQPASWDVP